MIKSQHLCPCCSEPLLRHASNHRVYWFCRQCHQEMPDIENLLTTQLIPEHWATKSSAKQLPSELLNSEKRYFSLEDQKVLQRLAISDRLTKIANRLRCQAYLDQQWRWMAQSKMSLSLILGDLDFFEAYNNLYGHQAGDRCLLKVAQAIASVVEDAADLLPDHGGEEFMVILPRTKAAGAHRVAQAILSKVQSLKIPHFNSPISPYLTVSLGVASIIPSEEYSADLLLSSAEQALYQAKTRGRDRLILHENLLKQIKITEPTTNLPPSCPGKSQSPNNHLMSYVAYYLSRGKSVISPKQGTIYFDKPIYQYSGYQQPFLEFWQQLQQRSDFADLHIDGDFYRFGQLLDGTCTIDECARCNLPTPNSVGRVPDLSNCTLCIEPWTATQLDASRLLHGEKSDRQKVIAIGPLPKDAQNLEELFFRNGIEVTFVVTPKDLSSRIPPTIDFVMLGQISEAAGKAWAKELSHYQQFNDVPIVALSTEAGHGLPWLQRNLNIADYLLTPHSGDRLAAYLRQMPQAQLFQATTELHWYPR